MHKKNFDKFIILLKMSKLNVLKKSAQSQGYEQMYKYSIRYSWLFNEKRRSVIINAFTCLLEDINLDCRSLGGMKRENCRLANLQVFQVLVLLPFFFFAIKGYSHYSGSALCRMFGRTKICSTPICRMTTSIGEYTN